MKILLFGMLADVAKQSMIEIENANDTDSLLNSFIDAILKKTGSTQINLAGHSAGGGLCYRYLNDSLHALKVAHYVHIGSMKMKAPAGKHGEVPTMNIYSADDQVMKNGTDIAGAVNVKQTGHDHMQVASSEATFANMYSFFTGSKELVSTNIAPLKQTTRIMAGRGVIMAENTPMAFDSFRVNIIDSSQHMHFRVYYFYTRSFARFLDQ